MPRRTMTPEEAVQAVADASRELGTASATLSARLPDNRHQERAVSVMDYETGELADALPVLQEMLAATRPALRDAKASDA